MDVGITVVAFLNVQTFGFALILYISTKLWVKHNVAIVCYTVLPSVFYFFTIFFTPKFPLTSSTFTKYRPLVRLEMSILFSVVSFINWPNLL